jgi:hypothetical protein
VPSRDIDHHGGRKTASNSAPTRAGARLSYDAGVARLEVPAKRVAVAVVAFTCAACAATAQAATKRHSAAACHKGAVHHRHGTLRCRTRARVVRELVWELPVKDNRLTREEVHRLIAEARPLTESPALPEGHVVAEEHRAPEVHRAPGESESEAKRRAAEAKKEAAEAKKEAEEEAEEAAQEAAEEAAERAEELREQAKPRR